MSELTKALIKFHCDVEKIEKNARGNYGKFADLSNVLSTVTPALLKNDLVLVQTFLEDSLVTTLRHVSGEEISSTVKLFMCEGRNITQEFGKAVTYQRRYSICSILGIVADMDFDGDIALNDNAPTPPVAVNTAPAPAAVTEPTADPGDPLPKTDYDLLIALVRETHGIKPEVVKSLTAAFAEQYPDTKGTAMSQAITTWGHCFFVQKYLAEHS